MSLRNNCMFIGRTGSEIEMHHFEGGGSVGKLSLAIDESYKNQQGEKIEKTTWVNLVARNKVAEIFEKYVAKGDKITVQCFYQVRKWEDKDGNNRYEHEFNVVSVELSDKKSND